MVDFYLKAVLTIIAVLLLVLVVSARTPIQEPQRASVTFGIGERCELMGSNPGAFKLGSHPSEPKIELIAVDDKWVKVREEGGGRTYYIPVENVQYLVHH